MELVRGYERTVNEFFLSVKHFLRSGPAGGVAAFAKWGEEELAMQALLQMAQEAVVFIARSKEDALVTKNMVMGESVYGEKRISVEDEAGKVSC